MLGNAFGLYSIHWLQSRVSINVKIFQRDFWDTSVFWFTPYKVSQHLVANSPSGIGMLGSLESRSCAHLGYMLASSNISGLLHVYCVINVEK